MAPEPHGGDGVLSAFPCIKLAELIHSPNFMHIDGPCCTWINPHGHGRVD